MSDWVQLLLLLGAVGVVFLLISRAMAQREARWEGDDWRQEDRPSVKMGTPLLEIQSMFEPDRKNQIEEVRRARLEEEGVGGDPPDADPDTDDGADAGAGRNAARS